MSGQPHGEWNAQTFQEGKFFTSRIGLAVRSARQRPRVARVVLVWRRSHPRVVATGARDRSVSKGVVQSLGETCRQSCALVWKCEVDVACEFSSHVSLHGSPGCFAARNDSRTKKGMLDDVARNFLSEHSHAFPFELYEKTFRQQPTDHCLCISWARPVVLSSEHTCCACKGWAQTAWYQHQFL